MRWRDGRRSDNVEDRRGMSIPRGVKIGGAGGLGILAIVLVGMFLGIDPGILLDSMPGIETPSVSVQQGGRGGVSDEASEFVAVVLADTEDAWNQAFREMGRTYRPPTLVLFSEAVESACGIAGSAVGPFYCPSDGKVYLDLSFFEDLRARFGAPGILRRPMSLPMRSGITCRPCWGSPKRWKSFVHGPPLLRRTSFQ